MQEMEFMSKVSDLQSPDVQLQPGNYQNHGQNRYKGANTGKFS